MYIVYWDICHDRFVRSMFCRFQCDFTSSGDLVSDSPRRRLLRCIIQMHYSSKKRRKRRRSSYFYPSLPSLWIVLSYVACKRKHKYFRKTFRYHLGNYAKYESMKLKQSALLNIWDSTSLSPWRVWHGA